MLPPEGPEVMRLEGREAVGRSAAEVKVFDSVPRRIAIPQPMGAPRKKKRRLEALRVPYVEGFHNKAPGHSRPARSQRKVAFKCFLCGAVRPSNVSLVAHVHAHFLAEQAKTLPLEDKAPTSPSKASTTLLGNGAGPEAGGESEVWKDEWCGICERRAEAGHWAAAHPILPEAPYACPCCAWRASRRKDLLRHFEKAHSGAAALLCPLCLAHFPNDLRSASRANLRFPKTQAFQRHILEHLHESQPCQRCTLSFTDAEGLGEHVKRDHDLSWGYLVPVERETVGRRLIRPARSPALGLDVAACRECGRPMGEPRHFLPRPGTCPFDGCSLRTSCSFALARHPRAHLKGAQSGLALSTFPRLVAPEAYDVTGGFQEPRVSEDALRSLGLVPRRPPAEKAEAAMEVVEEVAEEVAENDELEILWEGPQRKVFKGRKDTADQIGGRYQSYRRILAKRRPTRCPSPTPLCLADLKISQDILSLPPS